jgi:spermidine synthase
VLPFVDAGPDSTVALTRDTRLGIDTLWIDRGHQGDSSMMGRRIPERLGRLPLSFRESPPPRTAVIGLGLGLTLRGLVDGEARQVDVAELSAGVIRANRGVLADLNGHVAEREGVRIHHADGRALLSDAHEPYDLIVVDMIYPSVAGAGTLFSREFYALARRRLRATGVFVHWLPVSQLGRENLAAVIAAFQKSFPEGGACVGHLSPGRLILGLAGGRLSRPSELPLGPSELARLAGQATAARDADARFEYRSAAAPPGDEVFDLVLSEIRSPAWRRYGEAARAESRGDLRTAREL